MKNTRESVLHAALRLFAQRGYEAVSVSDIAGEIGITKGALYRHFASKRDIFDCILARMAQRDAEKAQESDVPVETYEKTPEAYEKTQTASVRAFTCAMFQYWTQDEFACAFRRMLTMEQFGSEEMAALYQNYLGAGPVGYLEDLFREMIAQGAMKEADPRQLAIAFYGPMTLLTGLYDAGESAQTLTRQLERHIDDFFARHATAQRP